MVLVLFLSKGTQGVKESVLYCLAFDLYCKSLYNLQDVQHTQNKKSTQYFHSVFIELVIYQYCHIRQFYFCKAQFCSDKTLILFTANVRMHYKHPCTSSQSK